MEEKKVIKQIDVMSIVKKLWAHKKKFFYTAPITLVATYLLMVCIIVRSVWHQNRQGRPCQAL